MARLRVIIAGLRAGVAIPALAIAIASLPVGACAPTPAPVMDADNGDVPYVLCNSAGCGDNVTFVIDKDK